MLRERFVMAMGVVLLFFVVAGAAQRPDFSGEWKLDWKASGLKEPEPESDLTIKHSGNTMIAQFHVKALGPAGTMTFRLDGSESTNKTVKGEPIKSVAKWQGDKLIVTHISPWRDGKLSETVHSYELDAGRLIIETTHAGKTIREVYTKSK